MGFSRVPSSLRVRLSIIFVIALLIAFSLWKVYPRILVGSVFPAKARTNYLLEQITEKEVPDVAECFSSFPLHSIEDLQRSIYLLETSPIEKCRDYYELFNSIYQLRGKLVQIKISDTFMTKVRKWLQGNEELIRRTKEQNLLFVDNKVTQESVVFNPVRAMRPRGSDGNEVEILNKILSDSKDNCDFCNYKKFVAQDVFGILESEHSAVVSNAFKIDKYHGMLLPRHHNPLEFTLPEFLDAMHLALKWFMIAHDHTPSHSFRHMYWDVFQKASASQVHPHFHLTLGDSEYYAKWHHLHLSSLDYSRQHGGESYWSNLIAIHHLLGLSVSYGSATAVAYLTPLKEYEVMVICKEPRDDFFKLLYFVYRAFFDDLKLYALSSGFVYPPLDANIETGNSLPAITRIVHRGSLTSASSDISSFDLFGTPNVNKDPFLVIKAIKDSVTKRKSLV